MRFSISQSEFAGVIQTVVGTVPTKSTLPVLSTLLVEAGAGKLSLTATDLDISVRTTIDCEVREEGKACLPARRLSEIARELPSETVDVVIEQNKAVLECGKGRFSLVGVDPEDFPKLPEVAADRRLKLETKALAGMIRKCIYAVSTDETRPMLNGVLVEPEEDALAMVATDGHRLAYVRRKGRVGKAGAGEIIVPPKALNQVVKLAAEEEIEVGFAKNYAVFDLGKSTVYCRLLEGPFPDYRQVIPTEHPKRLTVDRAAFAAALRRVAVLADPTTRQVKLSLKQGAVEVATRTADVGEAAEEVAAEYEGDPMDIGFNATYLLDSLASMESERVVLGGSSPVSAAVLLPAEGPEGEELTCLVMPVRLPEEVPVA